MPPKLTRKPRNSNVGVNWHRLAVLRGYKGSLQSKDIAALIGGTDLPVVADGNSNGLVVGCDMAVATPFGVRS